MKRIIRDCLLIAVAAGVGYGLCKVYKKDQARWDKALTESFELANLTLYEIKDKVDELLDGGK